MKKVLIYQNRKMDHGVGWDASTYEDEQKAFLALFRYLEEYLQEWALFAYEKRACSKFYYDARDGDSKAAKLLLQAKRGHEYVEWNIIEILDADA
jgi:hypothetical protein